ncbi:antibiotic biosynthesis monooxygenase [Ningiella sp. W23]|uniref:antibiotic biosynthesis monooxygenase n=1 Tax=Ningiella sp. W23 TaxID=3023715 RepID=UPI003757C608
MVRINDQLYIQIVRISFESKKAQLLADTVQEHLSDWISKCSGFISANLHVSADGKKMINYAQWRDKDSFDAFLNHEKQAELKDAIQSQNPSKAEADQFELVAQQSIEDEFWSKSRI